MTNRIAELRKERKLSQAELAEAVAFAGRGLKQTPRETGAYCVLPLPHTPTPGILPAGEKRREFSTSSERREKNRTGDPWH